MFHRLALNLGFQRNFVVANGSGQFRLSTVSYIDLGISVELKLISTDQQHHPGLNFGPDDLS